MIYRTAHRATYRNLNNNLGTLSYRIAQLTSQIASEKRVNTPSDDPSGAAKILGTRSTLSNISQYRTNIAVSDAWLTDSGAAAQSIKETLDTIYEKAEQGATDTNLAQRSIVADEISLLFQSLLGGQSANRKIGDSYIFGGQSVSTAPFALQVEAQKVIAGCDNSTRWTGKVMGYGDAAFNNRPDLPIHSQDFLIEVVQAGGVDSRYYSNNKAEATGFLSGSNYGFRFEATDKQYNGLEIKFAVGPANTTTTGRQADNNGIQFADPGNDNPVKISYKLGDAATPTSAVWTGQECVVTLQTDTDGNSSAKAADVIYAVNNPDPSGDPSPTAPVDFASSIGGADQGIVQPGVISYNNKTSVAINGDQITVYLERDTDENGGAVKATADEAAAALNAAVGSMITTTVTAGGPNIVAAAPANVKMSTGVPYTLARADISPKGTQNDLVWSVRNNTAFIGSAGNALSVEYKLNMPFNTTPSVDYDPATGQITVNVATSGAIYKEAFARAYNDPSGGAYQDAEKANELALREAVLTTANEVRSLVAAHPDLSQFIDVELADGNSGDGKVNSVARTSLSEGYDQPAMFRVSQDGGKTWGPPMSFNASEYKTGDMFYNAALGHASLTTDLAGKGNDLVFTANHLGTWGNDVRVEYQMPTPPSSALTVTVGPNPWNICVNLATDPITGDIISTANDVMKAINAHSSASQLVTADLANYHEGGDGLVKPMDCVALTVGEPYQIDGKTVITALGHAEAAVSFNYAPPAQSDPNIIFQAIDQGPGGNDIGVRYTTSADPTFYADPAAANAAYQDVTTVRYETTPDGKTVMVVHLATEPLPSCPDPEQDREASEKWQELYPLYSCTSSRAVITTAGAIVQAIADKNMREPDQAVVWASMERWPEGWDSTAKVGPTNGTVWLSGGDDLEDAANHGVNLQFIADGSSLQVGDIFEVPVGWYRGDSQGMDVNASSGYRTQLNIPGDELFGGNGQAGNILDAVQRLIWGLEHGDTELVGKELPNLKAAIEQIATLETKVGTRQIRNQFVQQNLDQAQATAETILSNVEDADFAKLITDLKNAQTVYEACLGATGLTNKLSLLNYI